MPKSKTAKPSPSTYRLSYKDAVTWVPSPQEMKSADGRASLKAKCREFNSADPYKKANAIIAETFGKKKSCRWSDIIKAIDVAFDWRQSGTPFDRSCERSFEIGYNLISLSEDAAFIVALNHCPNRFTNAEIAKGILTFLARAPDHIAAATAFLDHTHRRHPRRRRAAKETPKS